MKLIASLLLSAMACVLVNSGPVQAGQQDRPISLEPSTAAVAVMATNEGIRHFNDGNYAIAAKYFADSVSAAPNSGAAHYNLALALEMQGDSGGAKTYYGHAARLAKGNAAITGSGLAGKYGK